MSLLGRIAVRNCIQKYEAQLLRLRKPMQSNLSEDQMLHLATRLPLPDQDSLEVDILEERTLELYMAKMERMKAEGRLGRNAWSVGASSDAGVVGVDESEGLTGGETDGEELAGWKGGAKKDDFRGLADVDDAGAGELVNPLDPPIDDAEMHEPQDIIHTGDDVEEEAENYPTMNDFKETLTSYPDSSPECCWDESQSDYSVSTPSISSSPNSTPDPSPPSSPRSSLEAYRPPSPTKAGLEHLLGLEIHLRQVANIKQRLRNTIDRAKDREAAGFESQRHKGPKDRAQDEKRGRKKWFKDHRVEAPSKLRGVVRPEDVRVKTVSSLWWDDNTGDSGDSGWG